MKTAILTKFTSLIVHIQENILILVNNSLSCVQLSMLDAKVFDHLSPQYQCSLQMVKSQLTAQFFHLMLSNVAGRKEKNLCIKKLIALQHIKKLVYRR